MPLVMKSSRCEVKLSSRYSDRSTDKDVKTKIFTRSCIEKEKTNLIPLATATGQGLSGVSNNLTVAYISETCNCLMSWQLRNDALSSSVCSPVLFRSNSRGTHPSILWTVKPGHATTLTLSSLTARQHYESILVININDSINKWWPLIQNPSLCMQIGLKGEHGQKCGLMCEV